MSAAEPTREELLRSVATELCHLTDPLREREDNYPVWMAVANRVDALADLVRAISQGESTVGALDALYRLATP